MKINKYYLFVFISILQYLIVLLFYYKGYLEQYQNLYLIIILFSVSFLIGILIAKDNRQMQSAIDMIEQIVILKSKKSILFANKSFFKFFEVRNLKEFKKEYYSLNNTLVQNDDFLNLNFNMDIKKLVVYMNSLEKSQKIVKIKNRNNNSLIVDIKIDKIEQEEVCIIILSDITQLKLNTEKFMKKANIDSLTNIYSRQKFNELYEIELDRSARYLNPLTILFIDIDFFKIINDTHGHAVGDATLETFAKVVSENIREFDIFARWGGEEFILLLPQTNINDGYKLAEKIRTIISSYEFKDIKSLTCSIGVSSLIKGDNTQSLLKRADQGLYKAKKNGRNRTILEI